MDRLVFDSDANPLGYWDRTTIKPLENTEHSPRKDTAMFISKKKYNELHDRYESTVKSYEDKLERDARMLNKYEESHTELERQIDDLNQQLASADLQIDFFQHLIGKLRDILGIENVPEETSEDTKTEKLS